MSSAPRSTPPHLAWLLPAGALFFACGILIGRICLNWHPALILLALGLAAACVSRRWARSLAVLTLGLAAGLFLGWQAYHPTLPPEGTFVIRGTVAAEVTQEESGRVQTILADVTLDGSAAPDGYWTWYLDEGEELPSWLVPGAQVEMTARVYHPSGSANPGGFNFQEYLLQRDVGIGVYGAKDLRQLSAGFSLTGAMASVRHALSLQLLEVMGPEAGAYAAAMLLGTKTYLPESDQEDFQALGIAHILTVSGCHVGVLAGLMLWLLRPLPLGRKPRTVLVALLLAAYCLLTGGSAPVVRAAGLLLWREYTRIRRRQVVPLHLLCVMAVLQLAFNPALLTGASFQLTYGAMLGLTVVYPWLKSRLTLRSRWGQRLWEAFSASVAAQLGILVPLLYWFRELPLLALVINVPVIAFASALMALYWLTLFVLPLPLLPALLGRVCEVATSLLLAVIRFLAGFDGAALWTRQADTLTLAGGVLLGWGMSYLLPRRMEKHRRWVILLGTLLLLTILLPLPEGETTYTQFSVGDADAALLQDKDVTVLIDTGDLDQTVAGYLHQRRQRVEILILTHLHIDHAGGLAAILEMNIPVNVCYLPVDADTPQIDAEALALVQALEEAGTEIRTLHRGDVIALPSGSMTVLWPEATRVFSAQDANDVCLVLRADIAGVSMLLTGDLPSTYEQYLQMPADILKVAHHGSSASTSAEFLQAVDPQVLLLSNSSETREARMAELAGDIPLYSTEGCGAVTVTFLGDGKFTVEPFLQQ